MSVEGVLAAAQVADPLDVRAIGVHAVDAVDDLRCLPSRRR